MDLKSLLTAAITLPAFLAPAAAHAGGALDATFGSGGKVVLRQSEQAVQLAAQPDGRLLALTTVQQNGQNRVVVSRHQPDGSPDPLFGAAGRTLLDFGVCAQCYIASPRFALRGDGAILVAVVAYPNPAPQGNAVAEILVTRVSGGGAVDTTFANAGIARVNPEGYTNLGDIAVMADGRIVIAGSTGPGTYLPPDPNGIQPAPPTIAPSHWFVTRLDASGSADPSFQDPGTSPAFPLPSAAHRIAVQSDGHVVAIGQSGPSNDFALRGVRYAADGARVATFAAPSEGWPQAMAIDAQDRVWFAAGGQSTGARVTRLSPELAQTGYASAFLPREASFSSILPLPSGEVFVAGGAFFSASVESDLSSGGILVKLDGQGQVDPGFGDQGRIAITRVQAAALARQADGKVIWFGNEMKLPVFSPSDLVLLRVDPQAEAFVRREWLHYPFQSLGTRSEPQWVTVTNTQGTTRVVTLTPSVNAEASGCTAPLSPGASCLVQITHRPTTTTALFSWFDHARASVAISDDGGRQATVSLYGDVEKSLVRHFYRSILGRDPDGDGYPFWNRQARYIAWNIESLSGVYSPNPGEAWNAMAMAFYGSAEYLARARDDATFLRDLYRTFFDRAEDAAGLAFWKDYLAQGVPREMILTAFMFSAEFAEINSRYFGGAAYRPEIDVVLDMYRGLLGRVPDLSFQLGGGGPSGLRYWVERLQAAQCQGEAAVRAEVDRLSSEFAASAEYAARSRSNGQYIADLYNAFLRRAGDPSGFQHWRSGLDGGSMTREDARRAFLASPEFSGRVQRVLQAGCRPQS